MSCYMSCYYRYYYVIIVQVFTEDALHEDFEKVIVFESHNEKKAYNTHI